MLLLMSEECTVGVYEHLVWLVMHLELMYV